MWPFYAMVGPLESGDNVGLITPYQDAHAQEWALYIANASVVFGSAVGIPSSPLVASKKYIQ
jgi:hypothetical protein